MNITISNTKTIRDIQSEFNSLFPYLKIQFFRKSHHEFEGSHKKDILPDSTVLYALSTSNGSISIDKSQTVAEVENLFKKHFGLNVQVFRKSGSSWLETTVTDGWTLEKQNQEGMELSNLDAD